MNINLQNKVALRLAYSAVPNRVHEAYRRQNLHKTFKGKEVTKDYLINIVTHERCGTHLCINMLLANTDLRKFYHDMPSRSYPYSSLSSYKKLIKFRDNSSNLYRRGTLIKSHLSRPLHQKYCKNGKVIYVVRNPFDCLLSFYKFLKSSDYFWPGDQPFVYDSLTDFIVAPLNEHLSNNFSESNIVQNIVERYCFHVAGWLLNDPIPLVVTFDALINDTQAVVQWLSREINVCPYLNIEAPNIRSTPSVHAGQGKVGEAFDLYSKEDQVVVLQALDKFGLSEYFSKVGEPTVEKLWK